MKVLYYLSSNNGKEDVASAVVSRSDLDTNRMEDKSVTLYAPRTPGIYYYRACVTLRDENNKSNNCSTPVTITVRAPATVENEAPVAVGVIPPQSLTVDGEASTVDISASFSDANGDTLTYAAWPDDKRVVRLQRTGASLTIIPKAAGRATVTVRATDPEG